MLRRLSPCLVLLALLAGCAGGGGSSSSAPVNVSPPNGGTGTQNVAVSIAIPGKSAATSATARRPLYVSTNTNSALISVNGGTGVVSNLSAGSSTCVAATGGGRTCTITVSAPTGSDTFAVSLYANTTGTGAALSQNTVKATITAGVANTVNMVLDGIVASVTLSLAEPNPPTGVAETSALTVNLIDASGATIIGSDPLVNAVSLTDSDTSGATSISKTKLASPADAKSLTVTYSGAAITSAVFGAQATGVTNVTTATLTPQTSTVSPTAFVDWPTYGYDTERTGYNPYTTGITPGSIGNLHLAWQKAIGGSTQTQPIVVTGVNKDPLLIIAQFAQAEAYDALTGTQVWSTTLPSQNVQTCGYGGISGTGVYDKALGAVFMAAGDGKGAPNHVLLYRLNAGTGAIESSVDVTPNLLPDEANFSHAGVAMANGRVYVGTGSDCEGPANTYVSWRGRVAAVDPSAMTLLSTFYTTWGQGGNWGGGGIWAWGGVSSDLNGNVFVSAGNGEDAKATAAKAPSAPFTVMPNEYSGFADHLVELSSDLGTIEGSNYPGFNFAVGIQDLDYTGVPVVAESSVATGCGELTATQGKGGELVINNPAAGLGTVDTYQLSTPTAAGYFMGNPGYSPSTGYIYSPIPTAGFGPPGLAAITGCGTKIAWTAQFGPDSKAYNTGDYPRSAPTITAGGVLFMGTPCTPNGNGGCGAPGTPSGALWAVDAKAGTVLGGGNPVLLTGDNIRMAPSADGLWIWVLDGSGNMYGMTVDPSVKAVSAKRSVRVSSRLHIH